MGIISGVGSPATVASASGGKVYAYNAILTTPTVIAPANSNRRRIIFHNPGTNNIFVGPTQVLNSAGSGTPLTPTIAALGGMFQVFPGGFLIIEGECQGIWQALANTGTTNPFTVMDSNI